MIYRYLVEEPAPIQVTTIKRSRPRVVQKQLSDRQIERLYDWHFLPHVRSDAEQQEDEEEEEEEEEERDIYRLTTSFAVACVNKQIASEVDPIIYGDNAFEFQAFSQLNRFLDTFGNKVVYLNRISIVGYRPYDSSAGRTIFNKLLPATDLHELSISHSALSMEALPDNLITPKITMQKFIQDARRFLKGLRRAIINRNKTESSPSSVLDIIKIVEGGKCKFCSRGLLGQAHICEERHVGAIHCNDAKIESHIARVAAEVRRAVAKELWIKA